MRKIGIDLGKMKSDICVMDEPTRVEQRLKVATTRKALELHFANQPASEIAIESCRDSRWVRDVLRALGHEVVVVDTSRIRSIGVGHGRRKNDRRDAEALARALWIGAIPKAHVLSERASRLRDILHIRAQLVAQRTAWVTVLRGQWQAHGLEAPRCAAKDFAKRLRELGQERLGASHVQAALAMIDMINQQLASVEAELEAIAESEESYERLCSVPGVKLIVSLAFIAAIDEPTRFRNAHQVQAFLGLVPSESSTGGKQRLGAITKVGNAMGRTMLTQASLTLLRVKRCEGDPLIVWAKQIEERRGRKVAVTALARRLAGVLWAMWCDGTFYDPKGLGRASAGGLSRAARFAQRNADEMQRKVTAA